MDMMRLLRSLEEFLYELVGWLVFYPRTFWRVLCHPGAIARYTVVELQQEPERQFTETISPVLMLILSVVLAHAIEMVSRVPMLVPTSAAGKLLMGSEQGLLLTRSVVFCGYALVAALVTLRRQRQPITRDTLRAPFSVQAFLVSPFVVILSCGVLLARHEGEWMRIGGAALMLLACAWYLWARVEAYRAIAHSHLLADMLIVLAGFTATTVAILGLGVVILR